MQYANAFGLSPMSFDPTPSMVIISLALHCFAMSLMMSAAFHSMPMAGAMAWTMTMLYFLL